MVRRLVKRLLRPVGAPLLRRLQLPFDLMMPRIEDVERRSKSLAVEVAELPTRAAFDDMTRSWLRLESIVAFLAKSAAEGHSPGDGVARSSRQAVHARILAPEKVDTARNSGTLRLNLGGDIAGAGYINVGPRELPGIDVVADAGDMPFDPGSVDEISSTHLIGRFASDDLLRRLLPHWRHLLKPGGMFRAVTPDGDAMIAGVARGSYAFEDFREAIFGGDGHEGDIYNNLFTPDSLRSLLEDAGFEAIKVPVRGIRNGRCLEFEIVARLPVMAGQVG